MSHIALWIACGLLLVSTPATAIIKCRAAPSSECEVIVERICKCAALSLSVCDDPQFPVYVIPDASQCRIFNPDAMSCYLGARDTPRNGEPEGFPTIFWDPGVSKTCLGAELVLAHEIGHAEDDSGGGFDGRPGSSRAPVYTDLPTCSNLTGGEDFATAIQNGFLSCLPRDGCCADASYDKCRVPSALAFIGEADRPDLDPDGGRCGKFIVTDFGVTWLSVESGEPGLPGQKRFATRSGSFSDRVEWSVSFAEATLEVSGAVVRFNGRAYSQQALFQVLVGNNNRYPAGRPIEFEVKGVVDLDFFDVVGCDVIRIQRVSDGQVFFDGYGASVRLPEGRYYMFIVMAAVGNDTDRCNFEMRPRYE